MIGDSVTAGAQSGIQAALPNAYIDGVVSRQFYTFQDVYAQDSANYDPSVVICALGTNGLIRDSQQVQDVINAVGGKPIYFVTVRVPLELQDRNNQTIRDVCAQNDNAGVIDWNGASEGHSEYLVDDGTHLTQAGIDTYAVPHTPSHLRALGNAKSALARCPRHAHTSRLTFCYAPTRGLEWLTVWK